MKHVATHILNGEPNYVCVGVLLVRWHRGREGWSKIAAHTWEHVSGWWIQHCGHQTANWPYVAQSADGNTQLHSPSGHGFRQLTEAQTAVEDILAGRLPRAMVSQTKGGRA